MASLLAVGDKMPSLRRRACSFDDVDRRGDVTGIPETAAMLSWMAADSLQLSSRHNAAAQAGCLCASPALADTDATAELPL